MAPPRGESVADEPLPRPAGEPPGAASADADGVADAPRQGEGAGLVGQIISGRYRVLELIATGGTSSVYLGQHVHMLKHVAIKVLDAHAERLPELVGRFQREAIVGAHLHHPNVASASDFGQLTDGSYFLVLEHVRGVTLDQLIAKGPSNPERACAIATQLAEALGAAHEAGIVHRDVKPRNVLLVEGPETFVKLIDFGFAQVKLATLLGEEAAAIEAASSAASAKELTGAGMVLGTVAYMAPETAFGMPAVDERSDLYALGIILYELLTGQHPFDAVGPVELFLQQCNQPPPPMAERAPGVIVPPELEALAMKLLAKDPLARYQRADEVAAALHAAALAAEEAARAENEARPAPAGARRAAAARWRALLPRWVPASWHLAVIGPLVVLLAVAIAGAVSRVRASRGPDAARADAVLVRGSEPETPGSAPAGAPLAGGGPAPSLAGAGAAPSLAGGGAAPSSDSLGSAVDESAVDEAESASPPDLAREIALEVGGLDAWAWRMSLRNAARSKDWPKGAEAVRALVRLDPQAIHEVDLQVAARSVVVGLEQTGGERSTRFFNALTNELGPAGIDVLYDVARHRPTTKAGRWAIEILRLPAVAARASPAARVLIEFREASCAAKRDLFGRITEQGDRRALLELRTLRDAECSSRRDPCCYRGDVALASAIQSLSATLDTPPVK